MKVKVRRFKVVIQPLNNNLQLHASDVAKGQNWNVFEDAQEIKTTQYI